MSDAALPEPARIPERFEVEGRKSRRLRATLYEGSWCLDVAIVYPGDAKAHAVLTLHPEEVAALAHRLDALAVELAERHARWQQEREAA